MRAPAIPMYAGRADRSVARAREVIERSRGWKWIVGRIDDLSIQPKAIIIRRTPGFRLFFRPWPLYFHFGIITTEMMYEHLLNDEGIWLKGLMEITIRPVWMERMYWRKRWR